MSPILIGKNREWFRHMDTKKIQDQLIKNAFDFLMKSLEEFDKHPKYSIIHFAAAVELFLKARLMMKDWTLVLSDPQKASASDFENGNFHSVSPTTAILRLKNDVGTPLKKGQKKIFGIIAAHRNKAIHFYHEEVDASATVKAKEELAKEQCRAWYHLRQLLTSEWKTEFSNYWNELEKVSDAMKVHKPFLDAVFNEVKSDIAIRVQAGETLSKCAACNRDSMLSTPATIPPTTGVCLVCDFHTELFSMGCPKCKESVLVVWNAVCPKCNFEIGTDGICDYVERHFPPEKTEIDNDAEIVCWECGEEGTVSTLGNGKYVCTSCSDTADVLCTCEYCGTVNTHYEASFQFGCAACSGLMGDEN